MGHERMMIDLIEHFAVVDFSWRMASHQPAVGRKYILLIEDDPVFYAVSEPFE